MSPMVARYRYFFLFLVSSLVTLSVASVAQADYGLEQVSLSVHTPGGEPVSQAASHPDLSIEFRLHKAVVSECPVEQGEVCYVDDGQTRTVVTDLPAGMYANPQVATHCDLTVFALALFTETCPIDAQVGTFTVLFPNGQEGEAYPLYDLSPGDNQAATFGAQVVGAPIGFYATVTSEDGTPVVRSVVENGNQAVVYSGIRVLLWGNPASPAHDPERGFGTLHPGAGSGLPEAPFVTMPSDCTQPMTLRMKVASWQEPENFHSGEDELPPPTGCGGLRIKHSIAVAPTEARASQPSGFTIGLDVPQNEAVNAPGTPPLRRVQVDFPIGVALSPGAADGLQGCTDQQLGLGSDAPPSCPDASKVGSVEVSTPLLAKDLKGSVYVGTSTPKEMFRVFVVLNGPGTLLKLPGIVEADPDIGQLTAVFDELPQLPFSSMQMHLDGGPGAPLSTPGCGTYTTTSTVTAWSGQVSQDSTQMTIDEGCGQSARFEPSLKAGLTNPAAGGPTAFSLRLTRPSGQQAIQSLDVTLPPGVLADVGSVPLCPDAQATAGTCPAASQIGTTTVGAGDGTAPTFVPQPGRPPTAVYLAGPYKGASYSLSVVVPAQAGPYDLGTVVVRSALQVDPLTTQVTVRSDPFPTILKGVPLRISDLRVDIDRPGFIVSPTDCKPMAVTSTVTSEGGIVVHPSSRFQVGNCSSLGFAPSLGFSLRGQTRRGGNPALTATLKAAPGQANIAKATVLLPKTEFIDQRHISNPCTRVQFAANACPASSILGTATAYTPLLDQPLSGPIYFRSNGGERQLPDLVVDLNGAIHITLVGFIDSVAIKGTESSRVRTRFLSVPDAPISRFELKLAGGKRGLIQNSVNLCKKPGQATVQLEGQNGKPHNFDTPFAAQCGGGKKGKRR
jgi:hypothetical protein